MFLVKPATPRIFIQKCMKNQPTTSESTSGTRERIVLPCKKHFKNRFEDLRT